MQAAAVVARDLARYSEFHRRSGKSPSRRRMGFEAFVFKAGFQAVVLYRISHACFAAGLTYLAWLVARINLALTGADIEFGAHIGPGLLIAHPSGIVIGRGTVIGEDATIYQGVTCGIRSWSGGESSAYPAIGDRVVLFAKCSVLGGITVGDRAVVGAHALVTRDVPQGALVEAVGAPAVSVREGDGELAWQRWMQ